MRKYLMLGSAVLMMLLVSVPVAHALSYLSIPYQNFNDTVMDYIALDKTYSKSSSWKATVTITTLTFNTTGTHKVVLAFANSSSGTICRMELQVYSNKAVDVCWESGAGMTKVGGGTWDGSSVIFVEHTSVGAWTIYQNNTANKFLNGFGTQQCILAKIGVAGNSGCATAGFVNVLIDNLATSDIGSALIGVIAVVLPIMVVAKVLGKLRF